MPTAETTAVEAVGPTTTFVVGSCVLAVLLLFAAASGGFDATVWLPAALFLVALLGIVAFVRPELFRSLSRPVQAALGALGLFVAWSFLSISWADVPADAWDGANRALLYLVVFMLAVICPWTPRLGVLFLAAFSVLVAALGMGELVRAARAADPASFFIEGRFNAPIGYHNADAALFLLAFWPALVLSSRRWVSVPVRALLLAAAGVLLELAVLPQSRGSVIALATTVVVFVALVPNRARSALAAAPVSIAIGLSFTTLLDVREALRADDPEAAVDRAATVVLVTAVALGAAGALLAIVDRRVEVPRRVSRAAGIILAWIVVAAVVTGAALAAAGNPTQRIERAWRDFKSGPPVEASTHFTSGLGSNRYDFWRVSYAEFRRHPLTGIGSDNFSVPYVRERRSDEEPAYPHSLPVATLLQTGIVGAALLVAFFLAALVAAGSAWRGQDRVLRGVVAAPVVAGGYWAVHASGDWLWEVPATGAAPIALLGLAASLGGRPSHTRPPRATAAFRRLGGALAAVVLVAAAASLFFPWLAAAEVEAAGDGWRSDPARAYQRLDRARRLNPLSEQPDLVAGAIASRRHEWARMASAFERALERNPRSWYAQLELAATATIAGDRIRALELLSRAEALNPREPAIDLVRSRVESGRGLTPDELDRLFLLRLRERSR